jgi:hypothetical protein
VQQVFTRTCVRESLQHGEENAPFGQRTDAMRKTRGKTSVYHKYNDEEPTPAVSVQDSLTERLEREAAAVRDAAAPAAA